MPISDDVAARIVDDIEGAGACARWLRDGNLIIDGMFRWLWDGVKVENAREPEIGELIDEEFMMYLHHQRERNGAPQQGLAANHVPLAHPANSPSGH